MLYDAIIEGNENTCIANSDNELKDLLSTIQLAENTNRFLIVRFSSTNFFECQFCSQRYESNASGGNVILYCPKCLKRNELWCDYGFGPVTPCYIYCGDEFVSKVTNNSAYYLHSEKFGLDLKLKETYLKAHYEADEIISRMLCDNRSN